MLLILVFLLFVNVDSKAVIVTACNGNKYFKRLINFIGSVHYWEPDMQIKFYDLGLTPGSNRLSSEQKFCLFCFLFIKFKEALNLSFIEQRQNVSNWHNVEVRDVPWNEFPAHARNIPQFAWCVLRVERS